jgi:hypothetical protein
MPEASKDKRVAEFVQQLEEAKAVHTHHVQIWYQYDQVYHGQKDFPHHTREVLRSRLRVPWAWQQVEAIKPRIMDPDPSFEFLPVETNDIEYSQALNKLVRQQLSADRFNLEQSGFVEDGLVRGLAIGKVIWLSEIQTIRERPKPNLMQSLFGIRPEPVTRQVLVTNRPTILYVDPFDFVWDPAATNDKNWQYVFHRSWLTMAELKQRQEIGLYKDVAKVADNESSDSTEERSVKESSEESKAKRAGKYAIWERWSRDGTVMVMCGETVLRDDPNPYFHGDIPFAVYRSQPTPRSMVGVSEVEKIEHLQEAIWTRDNQRIDAVSLALNTVLIVDPTIPNARSISFQPGQKIYATPGQRIDQLTLDPLQIPGFEETQNYLGAMQQMTGASPYLTGSDPSFSGVDQNTATGASIMQEEGGKRMMIKKLEYRLFEARLAKLMVQLNHQYLSAVELKRILGDDAQYVKVQAPEDIPMFLDVIPKGMDEMMTQSTKRQENIELLNVLGGLNGMQFPDGSTFSIKPQVIETIESFGRDAAPSFPQTPMPMPMEQMGPAGNVATLENQSGALTGGATV